MPLFSLKLFLCIEYYFENCDKETDRRMDRFAHLSAIPGFVYALNNSHESVNVTELVNELEELSFSVMNAKMAGVKHSKSVKTVGLGARDNKA